MTTTTTTTTAATVSVPTLRQFLSHVMDHCPRALRRRRSIALSDPNLVPTNLFPSHDDALRFFNAHKVMFVLEARHNHHIAAENTVVVERDVSDDPDPRRRRRVQANLDLLDDLFSTKKSRSRKQNQSKSQQQQHHLCARLSQHSSFEKALEMVLGVEAEFLVPGLFGHNNSSSNNSFDVPFSVIWSALPSKVQQALGRRGLIDIISDMSSSSLLGEYSKGTLFVRLTNSTSHSSSSLALPTLFIPPYWVPVRVVEHELSTLGLRQCFPSKFKNFMTMRSNKKDDISTENSLPFEFFESQFGSNNNVYVRRKEMSGDETSLPFVLLNGIRSVAPSYQPYRVPWSVVCALAKLRIALLSDCSSQFSPQIIASQLESMASTDRSSDLLVRSIEAETAWKLHQLVELFPRLFSATVMPTTTTTTMDVSDETHQLLLHPLRYIKIRCHDFKECVVEKW